MIVTLLPAPPSHLLPPWGADAIIVAQWIIIGVTWWLGRRKK